MGFWEDLHGQAGRADTDMSVQAQLHPQPPLILQRPVLLDQLPGCGPAEMGKQSLHRASSLPQPSPSLPIRIPPPQL